MFYIFQSSHGKVTHTHDFFHGRPIDTAIWFNEHGINCNSPIGEILGFGGYFDGEHWFCDVGDSFTFRRYIKEHFGEGNMAKYILELVKERDDLGLKLNKLKKFIKSDEFSNLGNDDQELLKAQKSVMKTYKHILNERIMQGVKQ
ncbi:crAss001_48 related protein [Limosilactobacillus reuteri]|uniref:crAss001_48 related protein n=1 Tax=Limosilactobacillus reuteri TaxID=1598 RepID=UPI002B05A29D|nr:hypothetical protein [Limosilactobacillus reuteri]